jgi:hypothetical protein
VRLRLHNRAAGTGGTQPPGARLTLAVVLCAVIAVIAAPEASSASGAPRCSTSNLTLSFVRESGATSHLSLDFALRNVGPATCQLRGYPGGGLLNNRARLINVTVKRKPASVQTVTLHTWQRAFFTFLYTSSGPCVPRSFSAYGLQFFPPNETQRLVYYRGRFGLCDPAVGGSPEIYPVRAGLGGI